MVVRITTWNVNGIRNPFGYQPWRDNRTFDAMFDILEADIVIMQELKIQRKDLRDDMVLVPGWDCYFSLPKHKKGYSGVGIYTRNSVCAPIRAEEGLLGVLCPPGSAAAYRDLPSDQSIGGYPSEEELIALEVDPAGLDAEGRCVALEFPAFVILGIYSPANSSGLRDDYRLAFISALDIRVRNLIASGKNVVVCGDLNVSRGEIDTAAAEETLRKEGISHEEYISTPNRRIFNQLLEGGEVFGERDPGREHPALWDICRGFHPTRKAMYTHWEQKKNARPGNFGSRIDFILCSLAMKSWFCESNIQEGLMGSDHCPVFAVMNDIVNYNDNQIHIRDVLNPPEIFQNGQRLREYSNRDMCATSAKQFQDFANRRSIRDMFGKQKPAAATIIPQSPSIQPPTERNNGAASFSKQDNVKLSQVSASDREATSPAKPTEGSNSSDIASVAFKSPQTKRKGSIEAAIPSTKRTKSASASNLPNTLDKGQKSLKNFFAAKSFATNGNAGKELADVKDVSETTKEGFAPVESNPNLSIPTIDKAAGPPNEDQPSKLSAEPSPAIEDPPSPPILVDPIVSKESWGRLFSKPSAPRCEGHGEPCQLLKSKKKGFNNGREFWMCSRPLGPTGQKERNSQWRCPTFIWSSDWNPNKENS